MLSRALYSLVMHALLPLFVLRLAKRGFSDRRYWRGWPQRLGFTGLPQLHGATWLHAVSVGEVQAAAALVEHMLKAQPARPLLITTTTPTGAERARALFGGRVYHAYAPYDLPFAARRLLRRANPARLIVMETEIWPNIIHHCRRRHVPVALANARLSARSAAGYRRVSSITRPALQAISLIAAQTEDDRQRFIALGAHPAKVIVTGNIKMDIPPPPDLARHGRALRRRFGAGRPIWIAASTHAGEENQVLAAHQQITSHLPETLLILAPRHPQRAAAVAKLAQKHGRVLRRTQDAAAEPGLAEEDTTKRARHAAPLRPAHCDIYLVDTLGELPRFFAAADVAFIGGSLVPVGGHNMIEAAALGVPVVFGPHVFNFQHASRQLLAADAARKVHGSEELAQTVQTLLKDAPLRRRLGANGKAVVEANRGALERLTALLSRLQ